MPFVPIVRTICKNDWVLPSMFIRNDGSTGISLFRFISLIDSV